MSANVFGSGPHPRACRSGSTVDVRNHRAGVDDVSFDVTDHTVRA
jgi:hypothetical protein